MKQNDSMKDSKKDLFWVPKLVGSQMRDMVINYTNRDKIQFNELEMESVPSCCKIEQLEGQKLLRPQLVRESFLSLDGTWEIANVLSKEIPADSSFKYTCNVPFAPEADSSGCKCNSLKKSYWYRKEFLLEEEFINKRILLHFGAVDQIAVIYINQTKVFIHEGGYLPFEIDITDEIQNGKNDICVRITDGLDFDYPYGKQCRKRGGMWYTPVSGIWQSVWIESVPETYISKIHIETKNDGCVCLQTEIKETNDIENETKKSKENKLNVQLTGQKADFCIQEQKIKTTSSGKLIRVILKVNNPVLWDLKNPYLYDIQVSYGQDQICSYFAFREITIEEVKKQKCIMLNHRPVFLQGVLDQGYYCDGIYTPNNPFWYLQDILNMKELGYNTLRKHLKVEPECFYYFCDKYGMLVMQDMVNNGEYSFFHDTALPTITPYRPDDRFGPGTRKQKEFFIQHCKDTVRHLYQHPCICYYTIFNEGWGQFESDKIYQMLKKIDSSRVYDSTSGWFRQNNSDVYSNHTYYHSINLPKHIKTPVIISECGGYSYKIPEHSFNLTTTYGYGACNNEQELTRRIMDLYEEEIIPGITQGICGCIYTQLSDVEDETNGLYTYDRKVCKVDKEKIKICNDKIYASCKDIWDRV